MLRRFIEWQRTSMAEGGKYAPTIKMRGLATMLFLDMMIPLAAYYVARMAGAGTTAALLIATGAAALRTLYLLVKHGELDGFAVFMVVVFAGGLAASFITGDARFLLLKNSYATIVVGLIFLGTVAVRKPLTFMVARRMAHGDDHAVADLDRGWKESASFRLGFYVMGLVWGVGFIIEAILRIVLIYRLDIDQSVAATNAVQFGTFVVLAGWNVWFVEMSRRLARRQTVDATVG